MKANTERGQRGMSSNATTVAIDLTLASVFDTTVGSSKEKTSVSHHEEDSTAATKKRPCTC
jgi:hypothetical protein